MNYYRFVVIVLLLGLSSAVRGQNVYEIVCTSFYKGKTLTDVTFTLNQEDVQINSTKGKNGTYQFAIQQGDAHYKLVISKEGYVSKVIHFHPEIYPFENPYEIQEIDLEFVADKGKNNEIQTGILKWSEIGDVFGVVKYQPEESGNKESDQLAAIYEQSKINGDRCMKSEEWDQAKGHYEIALMAIPEDLYITEQLAKINEKEAEVSTKEEGISAEVLDKINKGENVEISEPEGTSDIVYSVQLGAFAKTIDDAKFKSVPDFRIVQYDDFTRCFSGSFASVFDAIARRKAMKDAGYKDAWIVKMKDNQRIGF